jgi:phospholipid/cholesterol/gamma-HCH transport system ATP-binding protein
MRLGVLFQHGALFSALTVLENIQVPMREYLICPRKLMDELARLKIELVGLPRDAAAKFPSELVRRHDQARSARPRPGARPGHRFPRRADVRAWIRSARRSSTNWSRKLRDTLGLTVYMVTHDLDSLFSVCDRIAVLGEQEESMVKERSTTCSGAKMPG